mmetsp:Transcript_10241/g.31287  ORF Transcript_10241/g.31287 Transcript_10241/m.31287 type:complete len:427 (+) Transcript_10241:35-1315(+)
MAWTDSIDGQSREVTGATEKVADVPQTKSLAKRPYKVAMLSWESLHSACVGSVGVHVAELAQALEERGHEVHVFVRGAKGLPEEEVVYGVYYHRVPDAYKADFVDQVIALGERMIETVNKTEAFMNSKFDVMHCHDWFAVPVLKVLKVVMDRKCVFTCHSTNQIRNGPLLYGTLSTRVAALEQDGIGYCDRVISLSGYTCDSIKHNFTFDWDKLRCITNGFNSDLYDSDFWDADSIRKHYGIAETDFVVLYVGMLTVQKGVDLFVDAAAKVLKKHPSAKFFVAGDGGQQLEVMHAIENLELTDRIKVLNHLDGGSRAELFKLSNVVVIPSKSETFAFTCLEAWSARKPVVSTKHSSLRNTVEHLVNGLLVDADAGGIAWGITYVIEDQKVAKKMGSRGKLKVASHYSWSHVAELTNNVYDELFGML